MQDTSVQAMTEVALALSMAFFALLMLALLSMSAEQTGTVGESNNIVSDYLPDVIASEQGSKKAKQHFIFWHSGQFFNQDMQALENINNQTMMARYLSTNTKVDDELVVVLSQKTPVSEISKLQKLLSEHGFTLTMMTEEWEDAFEKSIKNSV